MIAKLSKEKVDYMLLIKKTQDLKLVRVNMSKNDFKKTYDGFTKFVLWGTLAVLAILVILAITLL